MNYSPSEWKRLKEATELNQPFFIRDNGVVNSNHYKKEEVFNIADMLIPLGTTTICEDGVPYKEKFYVKEKTNSEIFMEYGATAHENGDVSLNIYTCRHFDSVSGNCTNYENRPEMCRRFGVSSRCTYTGCTRRCETIKTGVDGIDLANAIIDEATHMEK